MAPLLRYGAPFACKLLLGETHKAMEKWPRLKRKRIEALPEMILHPANCACSLQYANSRHLTCLAQAFKWREWRLNCKAGYEPFRCNCIEVKDFARGLILRYPTWEILGLSRWNIISNHKLINFGWLLNIFLVLSAFVNNFKRAILYSLKRKISYLSFYFSTCYLLIHRLISLIYNISVFKARAW